MKNETNINLFMNCLEFNMDPETSYKRFIRKKGKTKQRRMKKFLSVAAKKINKRLDMKLFEHQVLDILLLFLSRANKLIAKDKKFVKKITRVVKLFGRKMVFNHQRSKLRPARRFPTSQKDLK